MANRRMFSLDVVDTDNFLEMSATAQNLYFHLGMRADDDGFVSSPKKIAKVVNCGEDDLRLLVMKGYIQPFESGVIVIRHWGQNNYIQKDRYKSTIYIKEREILRVDNGIYSLDTDCIQDVSKMEAQVRLGKDNKSSCAAEAARDTPVLEKQRDDFEKIYTIYPKKRGKAKAFEYYRGFVGKTGRLINGQRYRLDRRQIYIAVASYVNERQQEGTKVEFYKNFDTFMNKNILDYIEGSEI
ncbi:hypothetical protein [Lacrimispora indolis]|uniref:hypothetical protein n=1 Tax=Lacrimispora indolis TaxID=69825 RepID=UPI00045E681B|nr:hypothetical protein [Lacrimispora indolis]